MLAGKQIGKRAWWGPAQAYALTFIGYAGYTLLRKTLGIVKSSLVWGYHPFQNNNTVAGTLDSAFLAAYAVGLFLTASLARNQHYGLRTILTVGTLLQSVAMVLFGLGFYFGVHNAAFFLVMLVIAGLGHSTGWPCVVGILGAWFEKSRKGLLLGAWNSCVEVGYIVANAIGGAGLSISSSDSQIRDGHNWPLAVIILSVSSAALGLFAWGCIVPLPHTDKHTADKGKSEPSSVRSSRESASVNSKIGDNSSSVSVTVETPAGSHAQPAANGLQRQRAPSEEEPTFVRVHAQPESVSAAAAAVNPSAAPTSALSVAAPAPNDRPKIVAMGFIDALRIPGVAAFSFCLFFTKLVSYCFTFFLPSFLASVGYNATAASNLASFFDIGGIVGGLVCGYLADRYNKPAFASAGCMLLAVPALYAFIPLTGAHSTAVNAVWMVLLGILIGGPFCLITTAVSADLGLRVAAASQARFANELTMVRERAGGCSAEEQSRLQEEAEAAEEASIALVTGIVDGTGALGAALIGVLVGSLVQASGWNAVFYLLMACSGMAVVTLWPTMRHEYAEKEKAPQ